MDLRFLAESYSSTTYFPSPTFNARRAWPGGIVAGDHIPDYTDYSFNVSYLVQRELEKDRIREEIMAEMARRQALEDEVRREIRMEKELSVVPMMHHHHRRRWPYDRVVNGGFTARAVDAMPFQRHPAAVVAEFDSPPQPAKGRLLLLPKPTDSDRAREKMKAEMRSTAHATELPASFGVKAKEELSCALCQVTASSEQTLDDHFRGKKHKAKEAMLKATNHGTKSKWGNQQKKKGKKKTKKGKKRKSYQFDSSIAS